MIRGLIYWWRDRQWRKCRDRALACKQRGDIPGFKYWHMRREQYVETVSWDH